MTETRMEKTMKPVPYEEFESFPKHVEEFFDMIARPRGVHDFSEPMPGGPRAA